MLARLIGIGACALLALLPASVSAQSVRLDLVFEKPTVVPAEPVVAHVTITNTGTGGLSIPEALEPEYARLRFFVTHPGSERESRFRPWVTLENVATRALAPGGHVTVASKIFFGAAGWTFPTAGAYQVRAEFGDVSSPLAPLLVQQPEGEEAAQSAALLASREAGLFMLLEGGDHLAQGVDVLQRLASGGSGLSGYAAYALGASQSQPFVNLRTGQDRHPDAGRAEELLQRSRVLLPSQSLYFQIRSFQRLENMFRVRGNAAAANQLNQQLQRYLREDVLRRSLAIPLRDFATSAVK